MRIQSLLQYQQASGQRAVAALDTQGQAFAVLGFTSVLALAQAAYARGESLAQAAGAALGAPLELDTLKLLTPIDHPDPAHLMVSGTGLTHLGSAEGRDTMHKAAASGAATDSMRMFLMGLEQGKPEQGAMGVMPEWFYKGDGACLVAPNAPLTRPSFAQDGGEEPEIAAVYFIAPDGTPVRMGYCLGNEFSDHVIEKENYLWLAPSKLRQAAIGPELRLGDLPQDVRGNSRIMRDGACVWEKPFRTGEANMSHSFANIEHHHFKYPQFRKPGDVHVHFYGTATLSFLDGVKTQAGDIFEISADAFHGTLRNPLAIESGEELVRVHSL
jgi:hypothetical protein